MKKELDLNEYYDEYKNKLKYDQLFLDLKTAKSLIEKSNAAKGKVFFSGNGASAAISSHAALDFTKQAKINSLTFHDPSFMSAYINDYGDENWLKYAYSNFFSFNDVAVFISVSGESLNVVNAAKYIKENFPHKNIITFTGKSSDNTLKNIGDINFWVDSHSYNIVEGIHMIWLTSIIDMIIGESVYSVSP